MAFHSMAFHSTGSTTFTTDGELRAFNFSVTTADEKLSVEIEDTVTYEKWGTKDLEIHEYVTEHTIITQAQACDYATLVVQCLEPTITDEAIGSMFSSLSKASADDESRLLCVSSHVPTFPRSVVVEYSFHLFPQPVNQVEPLTREKQRLEDHVAKLSQACEQLKSAAHESKERMETQQKQHEAEVSEKIQEIEQLKSAARESKVITVRKRKQHEAEVSQLAQEHEQVKAYLRKSMDRMVTKREHLEAKVSQLTEEIEQLKAAARESERQSHATEGQSVTSQGQLVRSTHQGYYLWCLLQ